MTRSACDCDVNGVNGDARPHGGEGGRGGGVNTLQLEPLVDGVLLLHSYRDDLHGENNGVDQLPRENGVNEIRGQ